MKNIIFNKTESFVGRNTSDHACQKKYYYIDQINKIYRIRCLVGLF